MLINITKETIEILKREGMPEKAFLFLFSLHKQEQIYSEQEYTPILFLIMHGYIQEDFTDSENLLKITDKGYNFIQLIENQ